MNKNKLYDFFLFTLIILVSCAESDFHKYNHKVVKIIDGNTIEVRNGVKINLIGIKNTQKSYDYLIREVLNLKVSIVYDSQHYFHVKSKNDEVYAYLKLNKKSVNGDILRQKLTNINYEYLNDSVSRFEKLLGGKISNQNKNTVNFDNNVGIVQKSLQELVKLTEPSVFLIESYNEEGDILGTGTGFFFRKNGIGLSNYHVFEGGSSWRIKTRGGNYYKISNILHSNKELDYIIFKVDVKSNSMLGFSDVLPKKGEDIFVLGNPKGLESTLTKGVVSAIRPWKGENQLIQIDAPISPGSSGSPVLNMNGKVIGIATMKIEEDCESCNFAISIELINKEYKLIK